MYEPVGLFQICVLDRILFPIKREHIYQITLEDLRDTKHYATIYLHQASFDILIKHKLRKCEEFLAQKCVSKVDRRVHYPHTMGTN